MSERIKFTVWRGKWLRGNSQRSALLVENGCMCCLGFLAKTLGATDELIDGHGTPEEVRAIPWPESLVAQGELKCEDTEVCMSIVYANDDDGYADDERESHLRDLFARAGIDIEFRDGAGPEATTNG